MSVSKIGESDEKDAKNSWLKVLYCNYYLLYLQMSGLVMTNAAQLLFTKHDKECIISYIWRINR